MSEVLRAALRALTDLLQPRMLALAVWPMLCALALWAGLAWIYWSTWTQALAAALAGLLPPALPAARELAALAPYAAWLLIALVLAPLTFVSAGLLAAVLAMPLIVAFVAGHAYPRLECRRGGSFAGSVANGAVAVGGFVLLWLLTLPLWLSVVLAPLLPVVLGGWLQQRLFRYDALAAHADAAELRGLLRERRGGLYALGCLTALAYAVPVVNLFAPVFGGLAFAHYLLAALEKKRGAGGAPLLTA